MLFSAFSNKRVLPKLCYPVHYKTASTDNQLILIAWTVRMALCRYKHNAVYTALVSKCATDSLSHQKLFSRCWFENNISEWNHCVCNDLAGNAGKPVLQMVTKMSVWGQCVPRSWDLIQFVGDIMCGSPNKRPNGSNIKKYFHGSNMC